MSLTEKNLSYFDDSLYGLKNIMQSSTVVAKRWHAAMFFCGIGQLEWNKLVWFLTYFNTRNNFVTQNMPYYTALRTSTSHHALLVFQTAKVFIRRNTFDLWCAKRSKWLFASQQLTAHGLINQQMQAYTAGKLFPHWFCGSSCSFFMQESWNQQCTALHSLSV